MEEARKVGLEFLTSLKGARGGGGIGRRIISRYAIKGSECGYPPHKNHAR